MSRKSYVNNMDPTNPTLTVEIEGYLYRFSVKGFPVKDYQWLADVLEDRMQDVHDRAVIKTRRTIQMGIKQLLGL